MTLSSLPATHGPTPRHSVVGFRGLAGFTPPAGGGAFSSLVRSLFFSPPRVIQTDGIEYLAAKYLGGGDDARKARALARVEILAADLEKAIAALKG